MANTDYSNVSRREMAAVENVMLGVDCDLDSLKSASKSLWEGINGGHFQGAPMNWDRFADLCESMRNGELKAMRDYARGRAKAEKKLKGAGR